MKRKLLLNNDKRRTESMFHSMYSPGRTRKLAISHSFWPILLDRSLSNTERFEVAIPCMSFFNPWNSKKERSSSPWYTTLVRGTNRIESGWGADGIIGLSTLPNYNMTKCRVRGTLAAGMIFQALQRESWLFRDYGRGMHLAKKQGTGAAAWSSGRCNAMQCCRTRSRYEGTSTRTRERSN